MGGYNTSAVRAYLDELVEHDEAALDQQEFLASGRRYKCLRQLKARACMAAVNQEKTKRAAKKEFC